MAALWKTHAVYVKAMARLVQTVLECLMDLQLKTRVEYVMAMAQVVQIAMVFQMVIQLKTNVVYVMVMAPAVNVQENLYQILKSTLLTLFQRKETFVAWELMMQAYRKELFMKTWEQRTARELIFTSTV